MRVLSGWMGSLLLGALLLGACSKSGSSPPFSTQVVGPEGGTFELPNGFGLSVPPGALHEATPISLRQLTDAEKAALVNNDRILPKRFLGGFFAEPEGVEFLVPIQVVVPLDQDMNPGGLPLMVTADHRNRSYVAPTCLDHDPEARRATLELTHFSYWAEVEAELARAAAECSDPATACRCGAIHVETEASDFSSGECQSVSDTVRVTFLDCPGQPTEESTQTDETAGCDEEDDTGGGGGGDDPCEGELWAIAQEYIEAWQGLVHFGSTWEMVVELEEKTPERTRYRPHDDLLFAETWWVYGAARRSSVASLRFTIPALDSAAICDRLASMLVDTTYEELIMEVGEEVVRDWVADEIWTEINMIVLNASIEERGSSFEGEDTETFGLYPYSSHACIPGVLRGCFAEWPCGAPAVHVAACPLLEETRRYPATLWFDLEIDERHAPQAALLMLDTDLREPWLERERTTRTVMATPLTDIPIPEWQWPCDIDHECCCPNPLNRCDPAAESSSPCDQPPWLDDVALSWGKPLSAALEVERGTEPAAHGTGTMAWRRASRLRCVERCECGSPDDAICDDLNPCTLDSCALPAGVCRHEPVADGPLDDESPSDCLDRYCIGGEPTGMADDTEIPEQDEPGDCHRMACVDGEPTGLSDDTDLPPDPPGDCTRVLCHDGEAAGVPADDDLPAQASPTDCWRQVCDDGFVADVPDDAEVPPQDSPTDCLRQVCLDGAVTTVPAPEEPGC